MSNAVQTIEQNVPASPVSDTAAIIQVIERAALNPNVDIDKMERLLEMQERIMNRNSKAAYSSALARMQNELPAIQKRGKIEFKGTVQSRYALWEDVNEAIKPVLAKHGFAISFRIGRDDGMIIVTGVLSHQDGHSEETTIHLPADGSGSKNAVQAVGSSTSYGKRYTAAALLNLTSCDEDDDGEGTVEYINEEQVKSIRGLIAEVKADEAKYLAYIKAESVEKIPASRYGDAAAALVAKKPKK